MPLQDPDDIYSDPQTIGDDDSDDILAEDDIPDEQKREISQTPFLTEKQGDDRGPITELEEAPENATDAEREEISGGIDGYDASNDQAGDLDDSREAA